VLRGKHLLLALAGGLALSANVPAVAQKVSTDAVPGVNFSAYRTYAWVNATPPAGMNPVMYQRIIADFDAALASKGYQKASGPADLSLIITVGAQQKTDIQQWGRFGLQTSVYQYTQGQLSLDVFDTRTKQALWHGQVSKTVNPDKPNPAAVDKAINKLMAKFPATAAPAATPSGG
jgi:cytochrome c1